MRNTVIKIIIMQFSAVLYYIFLFGPNMILSTLFWNVHGLHSFHNVKTQVSVPYTTKGKIIVQYIFIYILRQQTGKWKIWDQAVASSVWM